jgi:hypothetical protein
LSIPLNESKLQLSICRDEDDNVTALKQAHILFDEQYPNGAPPGVLTVDRKQLCKKQSMSLNPQYQNKSRNQQPINQENVITPSSPSNKAMIQMLPL